MSTISSEVAKAGNITENSELYRKIRPLYIVQLTVLLSLIVLAPINYIIFQGTVKESHEEHHHHGHKHEYKKPEKWEIDPKKPRVLTYADEYLFKPLFIRSYHHRSKVLSVLKAEFEKSATMYEHGHHEEHDDHGDHGDHGGHGDHKHGHGKNKHKNSENGLDKSQDVEDSYFDSGDIGKYESKVTGIDSMNSMEEDDFEL